MPSIDYALAFDFIDPELPTTPYRLEFRYPYKAGEDPSPRVSNPIGQLVAVVKSRYPSRDAVVPVSRSHVHFNDVEAAVDADNWPHIQGGIDLAEIRRRIQAAGLD